MHKQTPQLIAEAQQRMRRCTDAYHDLSHVERVVAYSKEIAEHYNLTQNQKEALEIAAWWHDVGRTITKKPSFIVMPLLDDTISALMLWGCTIKNGLFGEVAGLSTRVIFSKSITTGFFGKLFLRKKNRILVDILTDADKLDIMNTDRAQHLFPLIENSHMYTSGYRIGSWWLFSLGQIKLSTEQAKVVFKELLARFILWLKETAVYDWHVEFVSKRFIDNSIQRLEIVHQRL